MPQKSPNYKLEYFQMGENYSSASDYRRFVTLDYNLESYVGVVGVGIINGWTIESVSGLIVQILPGTGIINGYFAESPYTVKQRSNMVAGDREIEVLNENDIPESNLADTDTVNEHYHFIVNLDISNNGALGDSIGAGIVHTHAIVAGVVIPNLGHTHTLPRERWNYINVIKLYNPTYNPSGDIENSYVKVVVPTQITLSDNTDTYIYASLPSVAQGGSGYFPRLNHVLDGYPNPAGRPPIRSNYSTYDEYRDAMDIYDAKLLSIHSYEWYMHPGNHFTEVIFTTSGFLKPTSSKILIGRVVTRRSNVSKIDTSEVDSLNNMQSQIKEVAAEYITSHRHGGSKSYDPPRIRLETDIRDAIFYNYSSSLNDITYIVTEKKPTSISSGHTHTYVIDSNGDGQTMTQTGSTNPHFHKISAFVVGSPEVSIAYVPSHIHTIETATEQADTWTANSKYIVYVNDEAFADETTSYVTVNSTEKQITFYKGISVPVNKYRGEVRVTLEDPINANKTKDIVYTYELNAPSLYYFMLKFSNAFEQEYFDYFNYRVLGQATAEEFRPEVLASIIQGGNTNLEVTNLGVITDNLKKHPFLFVTDNSISGSSDLKDQCAFAQTILKNIGDSFEFTPTAARYTVVTLIERSSLNPDKVMIEILGNTEVTGKLRPESILFINANKIATGEFLPDRVPFIGHMGRMNEEFLPLQYSIISNDGIRYEVVPTITSTVLGHYHRLLVDANVNGITSQVIVANDPVYYESDSNGNIYFIYHIHPSNGAVLDDESSSGLLQWQNNTTGANLTSSIHTHEVIYPVSGNDKVIYSVKEDISGNLYIGTSDGFMMIPSDSTYLFVINNSQLYFYGGDLWELLIDACAQYEKETKNTILLNDTIRVRLEDLTKNLKNNGDSISMVVPNYPTRPIDNITIQKISSFKMPNFEYVQTKNPQDVLETEKIIRQYTEKDPTTQIETPKVIVERNFNDIPMWSIEIENIISTSTQYIAPTLSSNLFLVGSNIVLRGTNLNKNSYQPWNNVDLPFSLNVARKVIKDYQKNYWVCTNAGILVSRNYSSGKILTLTSIPAGEPDILDVVEAEVGSILCVSSSGIFKTINSGKTWTRLYQVANGFKQIVRDRTLDRSTAIQGHYHMFDVDVDGNGFLSESIGQGPIHVHDVSSWIVSSALNHIHTLKTTLYALDNNNAIWISRYNGKMWKELGYLPDGECGEIFAAFGCVFVSQADGLYKTSDGRIWNKVFSEKVYCYNWTYAPSGFFIGCNNALYDTMNGSNFELVYQLNGNPLPILLDNGIRKNFGYAYSNDAQTFHFKNLVVTQDALTALVDFEKWYAINGSWADTDVYDVYINFKEILSTKYNVDKRSTTGYNFQVVPSDALLDFSATTSMVAPANVYDSFITVDVASYFFSGDQIVISSNNSSMHTSISSVGGDTLNLGARLMQDISLPATVSRVSSTNGNTDISVNIYNSLLSNIGNLTHDQVEDGLSQYSDGRPYKLNDAYLSNILQLTQALRYVYPDINSELINDLFYDFRYSWSSVDPLYPSIYKYIDVVTSESSSEKFYDSNFVGNGAKSINKILIGFGSFQNRIFVATDIGVFWAVPSKNFEANWFYINDMPFAVYDLIIFGGVRLLAATANGIYYTTDMKTWTLDTTPAISYPAYSLGLRWSNEKTVIIPAHTAEFSSDTVNNLGTIISMSGTTYSSLQVNQGIKISNAGEKNGNYVIRAIGNSGYGYGSEMVVSPAFSGSTAIKTGVTMVMGTWWGQWNGDLNTSNVNITNTLLVGGNSQISYNDGGSVWAWYGSNLGAISGFISRRFLPLDNGRVLLAATGTNILNPINYLLKSDDIGQNWSMFKSFQIIAGTIVSSELTDFNNTMLIVKYTFPEDPIFADAILDQQTISLFETNSTEALFTGKVIGNVKKDSQDEIIIYGNEARDRISNPNRIYTFVIYPTKINAMVETSKQTLFFGTDRGLYTDVNSVVTNDHPVGAIMGVNIDGIVKKIDVSGIIANVKQDSSTGNAILSIVADTVIRNKDLEGKTIYIVDTNPVEKTTILTNSSISPGEENTVEVSAPYITTAYVGKQVRILGNASRVFVDFNLPVLANQFNGGSLMITSKSENQYKTYAIDTNTQTYIDLKEAIIPSSTLIESAPISATTTSTTTLIGGTSPLQIGQNIKVFDSTGRVTLWVSLDREIKQNALANLNLTLDEDSLNFPIYSNENNSITLKDANSTSFVTGESFEINGALFEQLGGFSHLTTSLDSGHYHSVETVNAITSGVIDSFGYRDASYVVIHVADTQNFNIPIVQYRGDLFNGAKIVFTTLESINMRYESEVIGYNSTSIAVRIKQASNWNFSVHDPALISEGWNWEIDATNYGYTVGITYDDFDVLNVALINTAGRGSDIVGLENTAGIIIGDKIRIQDDTLSSEINYVKQIVNSTTIRVRNTLSRTYFKDRNAQIKVLRDTFTNTHIHQIRNNETEVISVSDYLDRGYPAQHSHMVLPLITDTSVLLNQVNRIIAMGSNSKIYDSYDNGTTWKETVDLDNFLEGSEEINGVSAAILNNNKMIVGATDGNLFVEV